MSADACVQVGMMVQTIAWTSRAGVGNTEKCWFRRSESNQCDHNILAFCVAPQSSRGRIGRRGSKAAHEAAAPAAASSTSERRPGWRRSTVWDVDGEGRLHVAANEYSIHKMSIKGAISVGDWDEQTHSL